MTQAAQDYIKRCRQAGMSDNEIKSQLLSSGWSQEQVSNVLIGHTPPPPPPQQTQPMQSSSSDNDSDFGMWIGFQYILQFISMFVSATTSVLLLHTMIDEWTSGYDGFSYYFNSSSSFTRSNLAGLIVSFPIFAFLFLYTKKHIMQNPHLRKFKIRKRLIYVTLVITFIVILYQMSTLIFEMLSGSVGLNFVLKFFVSMAVNGLIFGYYFLQVREDRRRSQT